MIFVKTIPGMGRRTMKDNSGEGTFTYDVFDIL
jgi:hypothetical protein